MYIVHISILDFVMNYKLNATKLDGKLLL